MSNVTPASGTNAGAIGSVFAGVQADTVSNRLVLPNGNRLIYPSNRVRQQPAAGTTSIVTFGAVFQRSSLKGALGFAIYTDAPSNATTFKNGYVVLFEYDGYCRIYSVSHDRWKPIYLAQYEAKYPLDLHEHAFTVSILSPTTNSLQIFVYGDTTIYAAAILTPPFVLNGTIGFSLIEGADPAYITPGSIIYESGVPITNAAVASEISTIENEFDANGNLIYQYNTNVTKSTIASASGADGSFLNPGVVSGRHLLGGAPTDTGTLMGSGTLLYTRHAAPLTTVIAASTGIDSLYLNPNQVSSRHVVTGAIQAQHLTGGNAGDTSPLLAGSGLVYTRHASGVVATIAGVSGADGSYVNAGVISGRHLSGGASNDTSPLMGSGALLYNRHATPMTSVIASATAGPDGLWMNPNQVASRHVVTGAIQAQHITGGTPGDTAAVMAGSALLMTRHATPVTTVIATSTGSDGLYLNPSQVSSRHVVTGAIQAQHITGGTPGDTAAVMAGSALLMTRHALPVTTTIASSSGADGLYLNPNQVTSRHVVTGSLQAQHLSGGTPGDNTAVMGGSALLMTRHAVPVTTVIATSTGSDGLYLNPGQVSSRHVVTGAIQAQHLTGGTVGDTTAVMAGSALLYSRHAPGVQTVIASGGTFNAALPTSGSILPITSHANQVTTVIAAATGSDGLFLNPNQVSSRHVVTGSLQGQHLSGGTAGDTTNLMDGSQRLNHVRMSAGVQAVISSGGLLLISNFPNGTLNASGALAGTNGIQAATTYLTTGAILNSQMSISKGALTDIAGVMIGATGNGYRIALDGTGNVRLQTFLAGASASVAGFAGATKANDTGYHRYNLIVSVGTGSNTVEAIIDGVNYGVFTDTTVTLGSPCGTTSYTGVSGLLNFFQYSSSPEPYSSQHASVKATVASTTGADGSYVQPGVISGRHLTGGATNDTGILMSSGSNTLLYSRHASGVTTVIASGGTFNAGLPTAATLLPIANHASQVTTVIAASTGSDGLYLNPNQVSSRHVVTGAINVQHLNGGAPTDTAAFMSSGNILHTRHSAQLLQVVSNVSGSGQLNVSPPGGVTSRLPQANHDATVITSAVSGFQANVVVDSAMSFGNTYWNIPYPAVTGMIFIANGTGPDGNGAINITPFGSGAWVYYGTKCPVVSGSVYTFSYFIKSNASSVSNGIFVLDGTNGFGQQYVAVNSGAGGTGGSWNRYSFSFTPLSNSVQVALNNNGAIFTSGSTIFACPQIEAGSVATGYRLGPVASPSTNTLAYLAHDLSVKTTLSSASGSDGLYMNPNQVSSRHVITGAIQAQHILGGTPGDVSNVMSGSALLMSRHATPVTTVIATSTGSDGLYLNPNQVSSRHVVTGSLQVQHLSGGTVGDSTAVMAGSALLHSRHSPAVQTVIASGGTYNAGLPSTGTILPYVNHPAQITTVIATSTGADGLFLNPNQVSSRHVVTGSLQGQHLAGGTAGDTSNLMDGAQRFNHVRMSSGVQMVISSGGALLISNFPNGVLNASGALSGTDGVQAVTTYLTSLGTILNSQMSIAKGVSGDLAGIMIGATGAGYRLALDGTGNVRVQTLIAGASASVAGFAGATKTNDTGYHRYTLIVAVGSGSNTVEAIIDGTNYGILTDTTVTLGASAGTTSYTGVSGLLNFFQYTSSPQPYTAQHLSIRSTVSPTSGAEGSYVQPGVISGRHLVGGAGSDTGALLGSGTLLYTRHVPSVTATIAAASGTDGSFVQPGVITGRHLVGGQTSDTGALLGSGTVLYTRHALPLTSVIAATTGVDGLYLSANQVSSRHVVTGAIQGQHIVGGTPGDTTAVMSGSALLHSRHSPGVQTVIASGGSFNAGLPTTGTILPLVNHPVQITTVISATTGAEGLYLASGQVSSRHVVNNTIQAQHIVGGTPGDTSNVMSGSALLMSRHAAPVTTVIASTTGSDGLFLNPSQVSSRHVVTGAIQAQHLTGGTPGDVSPLLAGAGLVYTRHASGVIATVAGVSGTDGSYLNPGVVSGRHLSGGAVTDTTALMSSGTNTLLMTRHATPVTTVIASTTGTDGLYLNPNQVSTRHVVTGSINVQHLNGGLNTDTSAVMSGSALLHSRHSPGVQAVIVSSGTFNANLPTTGTILPLANHAGQVTTVIGAATGADGLYLAPGQVASRHVVTGTIQAQHLTGGTPGDTATMMSGSGLAYGRHASGVMTVITASGTFNAALPTSGTILPITSHAAQVTTVIAATTGSDGLYLNPNQVSSRHVVTGSLQGQHLSGGTAGDTTNLMDGSQRFNHARMSAGVQTVISSGGLLLISNFPNGTLNASGALSGTNGIQAATTYLTAGALLNSKMSIAKGVSGDLAGVMIGTASGGYRIALDGTGNVRLQTFVAGSSGTVSGFAGATKTNDTGYHSYNLIVGVGAGSNTVEALIDGVNYGVFTDSTVTLLSPCGTTSYTGVSGLLNFFQYTASPESYSSQHASIKSTVAATTGGDGSFVQPGVISGRHLSGGATSDTNPLMASGSNTLLYTRHAAGVTTVIASGGTFNAGLPTAATLLPIANHALQVTTVIAAATGSDGLYLNPNQVSSRHVVTGTINVQHLNGGLNTDTSAVMSGSALLHSRHSPGVQAVIVSGGTFNANLPTTGTILPYVAHAAQITTVVASTTGSDGLYMNPGQVSTRHVVTGAINVQHLNGGLNTDSSAVMSGSALLHSRHSPGVQAVIASGGTFNAGLPTGGTILPYVAHATQVTTVVASTTGSDGLYLNPNQVSSRHVVTGTIQAQHLTGGTAGDTTNLMDGSQRLNHARMSAGVQAVISSGGLLLISNFPSGTLNASGALSGTNGIQAATTFLTTGSILNSQMSIAKGATADLAGVMIGTLSNGYRVALDGTGNIRIQTFLAGASGTVSGFAGATKTNDTGYHSYNLIIGVGIGSNTVEAIVDGVNYGLFTDTTVVLASPAGTTSYTGVSGLLNFFNYSSSPQPYSSQHISVKATVASVPATGDGSYVQPGVISGRHLSGAAPTDTSPLMASGTNTLLYSRHAAGVTTVIASGGTFNASLPTGGTILPMTSHATPVTTTIASTTGSDGLYLNSNQVSSRHIVTGTIQAQHLVGGTVGDTTAVMNGGTLKYSRHDTSVTTVIASGGTFNASLPTGGTILPMTSHAAPVTTVIASSTGVDGLYLNPNQVSTRHVVTGAINVQHLNGGLNTDTSAVMSGSALLHSRHSPGVQAVIVSGGTFNANLPTTGTILPLANHFSTVVATAASQLNLIPDSDNIFGGGPYAYWNNPPAHFYWSPFYGFQSVYLNVPTGGTSGAIFYTLSNAPYITVGPYNNYTLSCVANTTTASSTGSSIALIAQLSSGFELARITVPAGVNFVKYSTTFNVGSGSAVKLIMAASGAASDFNANLFFSQMQLELGSVASGYKPNIGLQGTNSGLLHGAMSVQTSTVIGGSTGSEGLYLNSNQISSRHVVTGAINVQHLNGGLNTDNTAFMSGAQILMTRHAAPVTTVIASTTGSDGLYLNANQVSSRHVVTGTINVQHLNGGLNTDTSAFMSGALLLHTRHSLQVTTVIATATGSDGLYLNPNQVSSRHVVTGTINVQHLNGGLNTDTSAFMSGALLLHTRHSLPVTTVVASGTGIDGLYLNANQVSSRHVVTGAIQAQHLIGGTPGDVTNVMSGSALLHSRHSPGVQAVIVSGGTFNANLPTSGTILPYATHALPVTTVVASTTGSDGLYLNPNQVSSRHVVTGSLQVKHLSGGTNSDAGSLMNGGTVAYSRHDTSVTTVIASGGTYNTALATAGTNLPFANHAIVAQQRHTVMGQCLGSPPSVTSGTLTFGSSGLLLVRGSGTTTGPAYTCVIQPTTSIFVEALPGYPGANYGVFAPWTAGTSVTGSIPLAIAFTATGAAGTGYNATSQSANYELLGVIAYAGIGAIPIQYVPSIPFIQSMEGLYDWAYGEYPSNGNIPVYSGSYPSGSWGAGTVTSALSGGTIPGSLSINGNLSVTGTITSTNSFVAGSSTYGALQTQLYCGSLGATANNNLGQSFNIYGGSANNDSLNMTMYRQVGGTSWTTAAWRIYHNVDSTAMQFIDFENSSDIAFGTGVIGSSTSWGKINGSGYQIGSSSYGSTSAVVNGTISGIGISDTGTSTLNAVNFNTSGTVYQINQTGTGLHIGPVGSNSGPIDFYTLGQSNSAQAVLSVSGNFSIQGQFNGSGAGLTNATVPNAALVTTPLTGLTSSSNINVGTGTTPSVTLANAVTISANMTAAGFFTGGGNSAYGDSGVVFASGNYVNFSNAGTTQQIKQSGTGLHIGTIGTATGAISFYTNGQSNAATVIFDTSGNATGNSFAAGSSTYGATSAFVNGTLSVTGTITATGSITGSSYIAGSSTYGATSASVNGNLSATGTLNVTGAVTLGTPLGITSGGTGGSIGPGSALIADTGAINTTDTILLTNPIGSASLAAGTTFTIKLQGTCTSSAANTSTFTVRFGSGGNTSDTTISTFTLNASASGSATPFDAEIMITIRTIGSGTSATNYAMLRVTNNLSDIGIISAVGNVVIGTASGFNSTISSGILSVSYKTSASTTSTNFHNGIILCSHY